MPIACFRTFQFNWKSGYAYNWVKQMCGKLPSIILPRKLKLFCENVNKSIQKSLKSISRDLASSICFNFLEECHSYDPQLGSQMRYSCNDCKNITNLYCKRVFGNWHFGSKRIWASISKDICAFFQGLPLALSLI